MKLLFDDVEVRNMVAGAAQFVSFIKSCPSRASSYDDGWCHRRHTGPRVFHVFQKGPESGPPLWQL
jgi:hypothetical protein